MKDVEYMAKRIQFLEDTLRKIWDLATKEQAVTYEEDTLELSEAICSMVEEALEEE